MVVVRRNQGGSYILAELRGEASHLKYAATRVKQHRARDGLTFPVQAFFNVAQWWQAMGQRPIEMPQEPESEDEASMDDKEGEREPGEIREVLTKSFVLCLNLAKS